MKNWQEIYNKYKDSELMRKFEAYYCCEITVYKASKIKTLIIKQESIKDIWGYLIIFAETKGYKISLHSSNIDWSMSILDTNEIKKDIPLNKIVAYGYNKDATKTMLLCAEKFFEET